MRGRPAMKSSTDLLPKTVQCAAVRRLEKTQKKEGRSPCLLSFDCLNRIDADLVGGGCYFLFALALLGRICSAARLVRRAASLHRTVVDRTAGLVGGAT